MRLWTLVLLSSWAWLGRSDRLIQDLSQACLSSGVRTCQRFVECCRNRCPDNMSQFVRHQCIPVSAGKTQPHPTNSPSAPSHLLSRELGCTYTSRSCLDLVARLTLIPVARLALEAGFVRSRGRGVSRSDKPASPALAASSTTNCTGRPDPPSTTLLPSIPLSVPPLTPQIHSAHTGTQPLTESCDKEP